ncbi:MAG TPA: BTAD domain-containing putative transcriptional regulator [Candidatus Limnocylindrales bacterium]|nr:BTAD domain-containing putative transcriptional regulator [Candidatus Limnocylindrales bacterium]
MIQYGVLGPLTVHRDEHEIPLSAAMLRKLLAWLLLRAGQPVRSAELAEILWQGSPPATSRKTIQVYVGRLRALLVERDAIRHGANGYTLDLTGADLDAARFEKLIEVGTAARRQGDLTLADDALSRALELWRGVPYADLMDTTLCGEEVGRLEERHLSARVEQLAVRLDQGRHGEITAVIIPLLEAHPFHERLIGYQMISLYRGDRQAEALDVFRRARQRLVEELGVEPGPALSRLHQAILRNDDRLVRLDIARIERGLDDEPVREVPKTVPAQLPAEIRGFTGRKHELSILDGWVSPAEPSGPTIALITGSAGVGKTALAVHWAHRWAARFPDGQLYLDLRGFDGRYPAMSPSEALRLFLEALGTPADRIPQSLDAQASLYRTLLSGRRVMVVLDNAREPEQIRALLPGGADCLVLITSRATMLSLVAAEGARVLSLDVLDREGAWRLLAGRLGEERLDAEPDAAVEIIERCAGLPLALAVVAARASTPPSTPLAALAESLGTAAQRGSLDAIATSDSRTDVRSVFSWSYGAVSPEAAMLFRLLGLHSGPDIAAPAVAALAAVSPAEARRLLAELAEAQLITEHHPGRYTFHDLLRAYAHELAHATDDPRDLDRALHRGLEHYLNTAHHADRLLHPDRVPIELPAGEHERLADAGGALEWFKAEHAVLLRAIAQAAERGFAAHAWKLAWCLETFHQRQGLWGAQADAHRAALRVVRATADHPGWAHAHRGLANAYLRQGDPVHALDHYLKAYRLFERLGDQVNQGVLHLNIGLVLESQGRLRGALDRAQHAYQLFDIAGYATGQIVALNNIGNLSGMLGDQERALSYCETALTLCRDLGHFHEEAAIVDSIGRAHQQLGNVAEAISYFERAAELSREQSDRYNTARAYTHLGDAHQAGGDQRTATGYWRQALEILHDLKHPDAGPVAERLHS